MSNIVKINPAEYGLDEKKAKQVSDMFKPMLDKMVELENEFNGIKDKKIDIDVCAEAKELRLRYVKIRTGTATIHKSLKQFYLQGGRFVDGWKNAQLMASQGIESKLMLIERHYEVIEAERVAKLEIKRSNELEKYDVDGDFMNLGKMDDSVWTNYLAGVKLQYDAKIEAERKAESDRIEAERLEAERLEKQRLENIRLQKEAEQREKEIQKERAKAEAERIKAEKLRLAEQKKSDAKLKAERDAKAKIEAELKAKAEAEQKRIQDEKDRLEKIESDKQKLLCGSDKVKLESIAILLEEIKPHGLKTKKYKQIQTEVFAHIVEATKLIRGE
jgi:flagellar biosynthesis GTPase FlhF